MIPNIFSLLGESIVGKHIAKGIIFSNSPKKFHPNGSRIQDYTQKTAFFKRVKLVRVLQKQRGQTISRTILFGGASPLNSPKKMNFPAPKRHTSPSNK